MKKFFLFFFSVLLLLILSSCFHRRAEEGLVKVSDVQLQKSPCEVLCSDVNSQCSQIDRRLCLQLCSGWNEDQKACVKNFTNCEDLYSQCNIESGFVFEPVLQTSCSFACNNYIQRCNIRAERSVEVSNQNIFNECLFQCQSWSEDQVSCIRDATFCTDIMISCAI